MCHNPPELRDWAKLAERPQVWARYGELIRQAAIWGAIGDALLNRITEIEGITHPEEEDVLESHRLKHKMQSAYQQNDNYNVLANKLMSDEFPSVPVHVWYEMLVTQQPHLQTLRIDYNALTKTR